MPFYQRVTRRHVVFLSFFHACFIAVSRHTSSSETRKFFYSVINIQLLKHVLTRTHSPLPPLLAVIFHPSWRETGEGSNGEEATSRTPQPLICRKFHSSFFKYSPHLLTRRFFAFASMTRRYVNANHYEGAQHKSKSKEKKNSVCCYVACY